MKFTFVEFSLKQIWFLECSITTILRNLQLKLQKKKNYSYILSYY